MTATVEEMEVGEEDKKFLERVGELMVGKDYFLCYVRPEEIVRDGITTSIAYRVDLSRGMDLPKALAAMLARSPELKRALWAELRHIELSQMAFNLDLDPDQEKKNAN